MLLFQLSARSLSGFMSGWTWPFGHQPEQTWAASLLYILLGEAPILYGS